MSVVMQQRDENGIFHYGTLHIYDRSERDIGHALVALGERILDHRNSITITEGEFGDLGKRLADIYTLTAMAHIQNNLPIDNFYRTLGIQFLEELCAEPIP